MKFVETVYCVDASGTANVSRYSRAADGRMLSRRSCSDCEIIPHRYENCGMFAQYQHRPPTVQLRQRRSRHQQGTCSIQRRSPHEFPHRFTTSSSWRRRLGIGKQSHLSKERGGRGVEASTNAADARPPADKVSVEIASSGRRPSTNSSTRAADRCRRKPSTTTQSRTSPVMPNDTKPSRYSGPDLAGGRPGAQLNCGSLDRRL